MITVSRNTMHPGMWTAVCVAADVAIVSISDCPLTAAWLSTSLAAKYVEMKDHDQPFVRLMRSQYSRGVVLGAYHRDEQSGLATRPPSEVWADRLGLAR